MIDISNIIIAIFSGVSAFAAIAMWQVSKKLYNLQLSVEKSREPHVNIWFNGEEIQAPKVISSLSLVNLGSSAMRIRTLRLLGANGQAMNFKFAEKSQTTHYVEKYQEIMKDISSYSQRETDIILLPNITYQAFVGIQSGQFKVEAMYYDNSFEFLDIDTSNLGGKYVLTGKGIKP